MNDKEIKIIKSVMEMLSPMAVNSKDVKAALVHLGRALREKDWTPLIEQYRIEKRKKNNFKKVRTLQEAMNAINQDVLREMNDQLSTEIKKAQAEMRKDG